MDPTALIIGVVSALVGAGGLAAFLRVRSENVKLRAEAGAAVASSHKTDAEAASISTASMLVGFQALFTNLQAEVGRLSALELKCRTILDTTIESLAALKMEAVNARASVVKLQDRVDELETKSE